MLLLASVRQFEEKSNSTLTPYDYKLHQYNRIRQASKKYSNRS
jgi:hypothetical protein